jgi:hypothetical protein
MLNSVPIAINANTRLVVQRHPNSMPCTVWKKVVTRIEPDPESGLPSEESGMPTLGGMTVLRSEDEADFEYVELGAAKCLFAGPYVPTDLNERDDAPLQQNMQEAQIECDALPGTPQYFLADTTHLVMIDLGLGVVLAYEVASVLSQSNIPPFVRKLVLNPKDDLHNLEPFVPEVAP